MSGTVDTRTVEMRFDNKNFESNVKQSMSTLDKLKQKLKLDGASKGLEEVEKKSKKLDFKDLDRSIDGVGKKFSALETIATGVFLRIGMKAADAGMKIIKSFTVDQIAAGWNKYADKTTAVQTIMANLKDTTGEFVDEASKMEYVERYLSKLMWFSDETSYSFTDMTGNVGKFIANGQGLEESVTAMQGIAAWAAMSGQNAQTASRAMYQISQAMGTGSMTIKDWMSIENANMATAQFKELAIAIGEKQGKIQQGTVTVEKFRDSLSGKNGKKWFDKDVMMEVFETYGEAADKIREYSEATGMTATEIISDIRNGNKRLEKEVGITADSISFRALSAAQEAKTFGEVISATADAASTKWTHFFESIFGNYLEAKDLWTAFSEDLYTIFVDPLNDLNDIMAMWKKGFNQGPLTELQRAFNAGTLDHLESGFGYVTKAAAEAAVASTKLGDDVYYTIEKLDDGSEQIVKKIKNLSGGYDRFVKKIYKDDQELLSGRTLLIDGFRNLLNTFLLDWEDEEGKEHLSVLGSLKKAFMEVFFPDIAADKEGGKKTIAERLYELTKKFKDFTEKLKPLGDKLKNIFKGFFTIVNMVRKFISALFKPFKNLFTQIFGEVPDGVLGFADSISTWIQEFDKFLEENKIFEKVSKGITTGINKISEALNWLSQKITGLPLKDLITSAKNKVVNFFKDYDFKGKFEKIGTFFSNIIEQITQVETDNLPKKLTPLQNFWIGFKKIWEGIKKFFSILSVPFKKIGEFISSFFTNLSETLSNKDTQKSVSRFQPIWEGIKKVFQGIGNFFEKIGPTLEKIGSWVGEKLSGFGDKIAEFAKNHDVKEIIEYILKGGLLTSLTTFFFSLSSVFGGTGGILKSIKKDLDAVKGVLKGYQQDLKADAILKIAAAIGILAGSMWILAQIPSDKVEQAGKALAIIGGAVGGFVVIKDIIALIKDYNKNGGAISGTIKDVQKGPIESIKTLFTSVVNASIFANDKTAKFVKICLGILFAALAILAVINALNKVDEAFKKLAAISQSDLEKGGKVIGQIMVAFGAFALLAGTANKASSALFAAAGAYILVLAIKKLVDLLAELGGDTEKMKNLRAAIDHFKDVFEAIGEAIKVIIWIGLGIAVAQTIVSAFASLGKADSFGVSMVIKQFGKNFLRIALSFVILSAAIAILTAISKNTSANDWNAVVGLIYAVLGIIGGVQTLAVGLLSFGKRSGQYAADMLKQFGKNFIRIAASLIVVAAAFAVFKLIKMESSDYIWVSSIFGVFLLFSTLITFFATKVSTQKKSEYFIKNIKAIALMFLAVASSLAIVAGAFAIFKAIDPDVYEYTWVSAIFGLFLLFVGALTLLAKNMSSLKKSEYFTKNLISMAILFGAVALSLVAIAGAFAIMDSLQFKTKSMWEIAGVFGAFMGLMAIIIVLVGKFTKSNDTVMTLLGLSVLAIALAGALVIVSAAFAIMDSLKFEKNSMWSIAGVFAAFLAILGAILIIAGRFTKNKDTVITLLGLSVLAIALAGALVIVAAAFAIMSGLDFGNDNKKFKAIAIALGAFLIIFGVIAVLAGKLITDANSWIGIIAVAALMVAAALSLGIVAQAFGYLADKLSLDQMNKCVEILTVFGIIVGILAGIGLIAGEIGPWGLLGLAAMAGLILTAGAACLIAGVGIAIAAKALDKLFTTVAGGDSEAFAKGIKRISDALLEIVRDIADNIKSFAIIAGLIALFGIACSVAAPGIAALLIPIALLVLVVAYLVDGIADLVDAATNLIDMLSQKDPKDISHLKEVLDTLLDTIIELAPKAQTAAEKIATALAAGLEAGAQPLARAGIKIALLTIIGIWEGLALLTDPLIKSFIDWINSLADSIRNNSDAMAEAGANLSEAVFEGLLAGLQKRADVLGWGKVVEGIQGWREKLREKFGIGGDETVGLKIDTAVGTITKAVSGTEVPDRFATRAKSRERANSAETAGKEDGEAYADGFAEATSSSSNSGGVLGMLFGGRDSGLTGVTSLFGSSGAESGTAFMNNFKSILNPDAMMNEDGSLNIEALVSAFGSTGTEGGNELMTAFTSTVSQSSDQAKTAGEEVAQSTSEPFQEIVNNATTWGQDLVTNFADGMVGKADLTEEAATKIGSVIHAILGFSEPKKGPLSDFHTYAPDMIKLWCSGIYDNLGLIDDSSVAMGNRINDGFSTALDYVSGLIDGGMSDELTIRPIMDLSEIQNGVNKLDSMLSSDGYSLSGTADISSYAARDMSTFGVKNEPAQSAQPVSSSDTFNNTFNITNSDPNAVADRVSRILQQQVVRKQAVWAR